MIRHLADPRQFSLPTLPKNESQSVSLQVFLQAFPRLRQTDAKQLKNNNMSHPITTSGKASPDAQKPDFWGC
jgi:hypothetical protein